MSTMTEGLPVARETEVTAKAQRRRFMAAEKPRVLPEADHAGRYFDAIPRVVADRPFEYRNCRLDLCRACNA